jgi:hypothetical protein
MFPPKKFGAKHFVSLYALPHVSIHTATPEEPAARRTETVRPVPFPSGRFGKGCARLCPGVSGNLPKGEVSDHKIQPGEQELWRKK